ncbi:MAG: hypothetical protein C0412_05765 [Flavobacterium sp.]|nr:hypothetical protein [Flavobacterium sp.]
MRKVISFSIVVMFLFFTVKTFAEKEYGNGVKGIITDRVTNKPVAGAAFYLSQSCYFSITDANGSFEIKNIVPGNYQIVISAKNYAPFLSNMYINGGNTYPLNNSIEPLPADLVAKINSPKSSDYESDYKKFERIIIGNTPYMGSCRVENPEAMRFSWNKEILEGRSNGSLVFVHKKFGYKLHCTILNFAYDTKQLTRILDYSLYFEPMTPKDTDEKEDWDDYRKEAYNGSLNHFLWAFRNDLIKKEDYEVFSLSSLGPEAKMSDGMDGAAESGSQFQKKILAFMEISLGNIDENQIMFGIAGFLKVVYKPRSYSKETSFLFIPSQSTLLLDKEGWTDAEMPFASYGLWGRNGISNMLPKEYRAKR